MKIKICVNSGLALLLSAVILSCSTPKNISYMEGVADGVELADREQTIKVQAGDKISIVVKSKDPQLSELFNLPVTSYRVGSTVGGSSSQQISCYSVTTDGCIDFPVLGKVKVEGMTREQIAEMVKQRLVAESMVKDPVVTVEFENLHFSVMGEVNNPGQYSIDRDKVSLLDALSKAGDLTIYGRRDNVLVIRQQEGKKRVYRIDLTNADSIMNSPASYLQQNDVVYVDPNNVRKRQATVNGNNVLSTSFWVSVASLLTSIAVLLVK
jgi:polysaccharide biosynthesis/export protein